MRRIILIWLACVASISSGCGVDVKVGGGSATAVLEVGSLDSLTLAQGSKILHIGYSGHVAPSDATEGTDAVPEREFLNERTAGNASAPASFKLVTLRPGKWSFNVHLNEWSASCDGDVPKGKTVTFRFEYGQPGCRVQ